MWQHARADPLVIQTASPADHVLLNQIVRRDEHALATLYDRHSRLVYSVALRVVRAAPDAEEVLQETFVRVWSRANTYESRLGTPAAWLARIARNCAIDRVRAKRVRRLVDAPQPEPDMTVRPEPATAETPDSLFADIRTADAVRGALGHLPDNQRTLIEAAFFDGYTHQELSDRFGIPLGTVKARIRTGLLSLRSHLTHAI